MTWDWTCSWRAILAGSIVAVAVTLIVVALGLGGGLAVISPWSGEGISSTTAAWAAGLFLVATSMIASTFGGYIAGRLRPAWEDVNEHERFFRDTAHGFVAWALATTILATVMSGALTHMLAAASTGAIPAAGAGAAQAASPAAPYVDRLLRPSGQATRQTSPGSDNTGARDELGRLIAPALRKGGDVAPEDKTYIVQVVAGRTGMPQAEAEQRVNQTITQAKQAADQARRTAAKFSFWVAAALLAGALASCLAAAEGGKLRSSRWYEASPAPRI